MRIETVEVGPLQVNCYLVWHEKSHDLVVIDPGDDADLIVDLVRAGGLRPTAILLTHGHVDHIRGVGPLVREWQVPVFIQLHDRDLYLSPENALLPWLPAARDLPEPVHAPPAHLKALMPEVIMTPGHTHGGVCFHFPWERVLFSGDTLFAGSIGRTDLPGGDSQTLLRSIRTQLMKLPGETRVLPGHGPETTIEREAHTNPYF